MAATVISERLVRDRGLTVPKERIRDLRPARLGLRADGSAHKRGYQLEVLLEQLFRPAHFRVERNPSVAKPRQTDLVARYGDTWYVIEAKWLNGPADVDVFDAVRSRMERAAYLLSSASSSA